MSRAFVDEDDSTAGESEAPEIKIPIPQGSRNYLTPEGAERLSRELHELVQETRPRILADVARMAGADKDELAALRRSLGLVERRVEYLSMMSSLAEVIPPPEGGYDRVKFGARIRVREAPGGGAAEAGEGPRGRPGAAGAESEYRIVGVDEAEPERGLIGWTSPVARALMGKRPGEVALVRLPAGERRLEILAVE
ncbi:MAG TPA: GreA/GreB family elongation factor [Spirochaetia bacterium]|nr:GreA/GreB family elongation factor [Spirochaetales bacterium]HRY71941.1 GreA/GreB family elongation factor [Spirochaetia bacterium]